MGELGTRFKRGEVVFRSGDPADCMYVVQQGRIEIAMESELGSTRLSVRKKGEFFGETSMLACKTRFATARALKDSRVLKLDEKTFLAKLHQDPSLAFRTIQQMAKRIYDQDHALMRGFSQQSRSCCEVTGFASYIDLAAFLDGEVRRAGRLRQTMAFAIIDIDNFKAIIETHGPGVGESTLRALSAILQEHLRGSDIVGRFGDDRFGVLLYEADGPTAVKVMEMVRSAFADHWFEAELDGIEPTFTCGIAVYPEHDKSVRLNKMAYKTLIEGKIAGKNRIVLAPPEPGNHLAKKSVIKMAAYKGRDHGHEGKITMRAILHAYKKALQEKLGDVVPTTWSKFSAWRLPFQRK